MLTAHVKEIVEPLLENKADTVAGVIPDTQLPKTYFGNSITGTGETEETALEINTEAIKNYLMGLPGTGTVLKKTQTGLEWGTP